MAEETTGSETKAMKRAWIQLPTELFEAAEKIRKRRYLPSFTEYIRSLVRKDIARELEEAAEKETVDIQALAKALAAQED